MKIRSLCLVLALVVFAPATNLMAYLSQGITEPVCDVVLSPSVSGIVNNWKFKEGDFVENGAVIIELDNKLEQLEAERYKLAMESKRKEWESIKKLTDNNSISVKQEDLEKAETDYQIAVTEYKLAQEQLLKKSIVSPCSGYIAEISRHPGEAAQEYQPIARVVDTRQCYFISDVEAQAAGHLKIGEMIKLEIENGSETVMVTGKIIFLSPVVDSASGLQHVRALFDNGEGRIRPGVTAKMIFD